MYRVQFSMLSTLNSGLEYGFGPRFDPAAAPVPCDFILLSPGVCVVVHKCECV